MEYSTDMYEQYEIYELLKCLTVENVISEN